MLAWQIYLKKKLVKLKNNQLKYQELVDLISSVSKKTINQLLAHPEITLSQKQVKELDALIKKRLASWPLAYLLTNSYFYKLKFKVSPQVLIPRPETELLVEEILQEVKLKPQKNLTIIDVGAGSGAIILSLANDLKQHKNIKYLATDISQSALSIARQNARNIKLITRIKFIQTDLLVNIKCPTNNLIIAANLPYLTTQQLLESSIKYEPRLALFGGFDGLDVYRRLFKQIKNWSNYKKLSLYLEINPFQVKKIKKIATDHWPLANIETRKDLNQKNRLIIIKIN